MRIYYLSLLLFIFSQCTICAADVEERVSSKPVMYKPTTFKFVEDAPVDDMASVKKDAMKSFTELSESLRTLKEDERRNELFIKRREKWAQDLADFVGKIDEGHFKDPFAARSRLWELTQEHTVGFDYQ